MANKEIRKGEIIIYKSAKGPEIQVKFDRETIWLTQEQISELFMAERSVITKHLRNIFNSKELSKNSVCAKIAHTAPDGKTYKIQFYNIDAIISVGYRVNSQRATQFRIWATKTLKNYLLNGYVVNEKRLLEAKGKFKELQNAIAFLRQKAQSKLLIGQEKEILNLLADYAKTLTLLEQYDKNGLKEIKGKRAGFVLDYKHCLEIIVKIKNNFKIYEESLVDNFRNSNSHNIVHSFYYFNF